MTRTKYSEKAAKDLEKIYKLYEVDPFLHLREYDKRRLRRIYCKNRTG